jgi:HK97 family phage prohead protease
VLVSTGADLSNYRRNPVVLWAHDYSRLPVARAVEIDAVPGVGLRAKMEFAPAGVDAHIDAVRTLWEHGFLNAASVGFTPKAGTPTGKGGTRYTEWELLEFSIVPIPANADALRLAFDGAAAKSGRVLSAKNESALRAAVDTLLSVLSQLDKPEPEPMTESVKSDETPAEVIDSLDAIFKEIRNGYSR